MVVFDTETIFLLRLSALTKKHAESQAAYIAIVFQYDALRGKMVKTATHVNTAYFFMILNIKELLLAQ